MTLLFSLMLDSTATLLVPLTPISSSHSSFLPHTIASHHQDHNKKKTRRSPMHKARLRARHFFPFPNFREKDQAAQTWGGICCHAIAFEKIWAEAIQVVLYPYKLIRTAASVFCFCFCFWVCVWRKNDPSKQELGFAIGDLATLNSCCICTNCPVAVGRARRGIVGGFFFVFGYDDEVHYPLERAPALDSGYFPQLGKLCFLLLQSCNRKDVRTWTKVCNWWDTFWIFATSLQARGVWLRCWSQLKKDALHLPSLNCIWEEVGGPICWPYDGFSSPLLMPSCLSPPAASRKGIRLLSSDGTNDSMTNEDLDKKVNQVASCKTQESVKHPHSHRRYKLFTHSLTTWCHSCCSEAHHSLGWSFHYMLLFSLKGHCLILIPTPQVRILRILYQPHQRSRFYASCSHTQAHTM